MRILRLPMLVLAMAVLTVGTAGAQQPGGLAPGVFGLDGSVGLLDRRVADTKSAVEKAVGISISGFLDTSYTWSTNRPGYANDDDISLRVFDKDHNEIVFNHFNLTLEKPEKDLGVGFKLVTDFGRTAELLREATNWGPRLQTPGMGSGGEPSVELREAFLTTTLPLGTGLQIKGGLFVTTLGTEILPNPGAYNENISRSYIFGYPIPFRHVGMLFSYPVHPVLTVTAGPVTGWDMPHDVNGQPSFLGGLSLTPSDKFFFGSNLIVGPEQRHNSGRKRLAWSNVATIKPVDPLTLFLEYTYGHEEEVTASLRDATWQAWAAIASYGWTDRFSTALRGEIFKDSDGARLGGNLAGTHLDVTVAELTLTGAYKFTEKLLGRAEVRQDWADEKVFQKRDTGSSKSQTTLALQVIYTF
jgi:hypothetical protein